uniref:Methyltransferase n=2 Tax=Dunaliella tertiolecta TaxID=3047 RepID=A0A7S3R7I8_DUNTE|mmetsp:Transcript_22012/g.57419  ORF Transcript_22012/g.57419 Transcript_22012/m.57419 type:complete len:277 (+) Transcript_22012:652-1482(+)
MCVCRHRYKGESHECSLKRHEHYLALKLSLKPEHQVLDVGCGVGGPLREVALFSGAQITGLNNNDYQIKKGTEYNRAVGQGLTERCGFLKADFMDIPKEANSYDAVYAIDATCHAPDAVKCYQEIFRVLKPGCMFAGYEWCSTDLNDPSNPKHKAILDEIELGNGLPDIRSTEQVKAALLAAGFIIKETVDLANSADVPWYEPIDPSRFSLTAFRTTRLGRMLTRNLVCALEKTGFAPQGSGRVAAFLERAGDGLVAGGKEGIFTPLYFFLVQKPE